MNITDKYDIFLFDLDGTLTDTGPGIRNSVAFALKQQGIDVGDMSELNRFIGPPLFDSFQSFYGMSDEQAAKAVADYRSVYSKKGIYENEIYPGMKALLSSLFQSGKTLLVATSKPEKFARKIIDDLGLAQYFKYVAGADMEGLRNKKSKVIEYALSTCDIKERSRVVMIGDTKFDILGACECGIDSIGVLYGYGNAEELVNATGIARNVEELYKIFLIQGKNT
ncbi:MAG: HAD family hydrolase [Clostridium sp.]|nr:HAD family hydrolase [Clostridium sp.]MCM1399493.1 HAD family hydrolase [Clostridium sp.]MCM1460047.1 HAD family hydrolase [Bacteroides sp.]